MPVFLGALRRTVSPFRQFHIQWAVTKRHKHSKKHAVNAVEQQKAEGFYTLASPHSVEVEVKKSRFLATAWPVSSPEEALTFIESSKDASASHNCWAYKVGQQYRSTDDGEPGGTAGRPILAALEGEGLDCVCVLVIRYYGGIKLGAGGLVRAYGGAARDCLRAAPKKHMVPKALMALQVPFDLIGPIYPVLERYAAEKLREEYGDGGVVSMELCVEQNVAHQLQQAVQNATAGRVVPTFGRGGGARG